MYEEGYNSSAEKLNAQFIEQIIHYENENSSSKIEGNSVVGINSLLELTIHGSHNAMMKYVDLSNKIRLY